MANKYITNLSITDGNLFKIIWNLTRAMKAAGWTYKASSGGTSKDTTGTATNDMWGGASDPLTDTFPFASSGIGAWWCCRGPSSWKVLIDSASTGTFLKGEKITSSGGEAELVGYLWDPVTATGWVTCIMRTGSFSTGATLTGATSGATVACHGTTAPLEQVHEIVFWRDSTSQTKGWIFLQCIEVTNQPTKVFSTLATQTDCTATIAPGGGVSGSGNNPPERYPTVGSWVGRGTINISSWPTLTYTSTNWFGGNNTDPAVGGGKAQIVVVNAVPSAGVTPDGTFWVMAGFPGTATNASTGWMYGRVDDMEDGDIDPWVWWTGTFTQGSLNHLESVSQGSSYDLWSYRDHWGNNLGYPGMYTTTKRRGYAAGGGNAGWICGHTARLVHTSLNYNYPVMFGSDASSYPIPMRAFDHPLNPTGTAPLVREPVWLAGGGGGPFRTKKFLKGTMRWMWYSSVGTAYDTYDAKTWVQVCTTDTANGYVGLVLGPWDGTTVPLNA